MNSDLNQEDQESGIERSYETVGYSESIDEALATLQESQMELSHMADSKANIMITVSSILLTLAIAKIEEGVLVIPGTLLVVFCVPALIFAILCVMPSAPVPVRSIRQNGKLKNFNPLFFHHFTLIPVKEFEREIERIMTDPGNLYRSLSRDVYNAGTVLKVKKYRYLRWSYISLMAGILAGFAAAVIELASRL